MSDLRQMPLPLADQPLNSSDDINRYTLFELTIPLFAQHLIQEGKSDHTIKAFRADLMLVSEHLGDTIPITQFTTGILNDFLNWLENGRDVPCSRKSYARRVTTLKVYFKWLHELGAIPYDPAKAVLQRSGPAPLSNILSMSQIRDAVEFSRLIPYKKTQEMDTRPEFLFRLLLDTGIKKSEAARLTTHDFDRLNPRVPILTIRHKSRNVYKERRIELDPELIALLDAYLEQYKLTETTFNCTPRNLEYILTDIGKGAGIPFKLSFEVMRWTCAVRDYRLGMDDQTNREKLGLSEASWQETGKKIRTLAEKLAAKSADKA